MKKEVGLSRYSQDRLHQIQACINSFVSEDYIIHSRVHRFFLLDTPESCCYIKRDDELGPLQTGSKIRKYASLIPYLIQNRIEEVIIIGSLHSNNVVGLCQLLKQNRIDVRLFLLKPTQSEKRGNALLTSLMVSKEQIEWVSRHDWSQVLGQCAAYARNRCKQGKSTYIVEEGASTQEAIPGALTLALDIIRNEEKIGRSFDHIFIDVGTGMMAMALILGMSWMQSSCCVHLVHMTPFSDSLFKCQLERYRQWLSQHLIEPMNALCAVMHHIPSHNRSFGSITPSLFQTIHRVAHSEGVLLDPIYSAKLFLTVEQLIQKNAVRGSILWIHSGGVFSLSGFQDHLRNCLRT